ncbi:VIT1/CCC1 transporter family protein, partial [Mycobacteroides abscessus]
ELHIDPHGLTNPWHAAVSSAVSFLTGAMLPMIAILLPPAAWRIQVTALGVCVALVLTGWISAALGEAGRIRAISRVTFGGLAAMGVTYLIGTLVGHAMS